MKKMVFLSGFVGLSSIALLAGSIPVSADILVSPPEYLISAPVENTMLPATLNETSIQEISPQATLTHYWSDGWVKTGNPAPAVAFFRKGAYRGWLSKYRDLPQPYGTLGYYSGYLYHDSVPLPSPAKVDPSELL